MAAETTLVPIGDGRKEGQSPLFALVERLAANPDIDPTKAERLIDVFISGQRRMLEMQDEQAFAQAMADFKQDPPEIIKRKTAHMKGVAKNSGREYEMSYSYADLAEYSDAAMPALAERGITWSFPFSEDEKGRITVSCILRHGLYEHRPTTLSAMPDGSGNKNDLQQKGSTISYLERYTLCGATGLVAVMPDTDGNKVAAGAENAPETRMPEEKAQEWVEAIRDAGSFDELKDTYSKAQKAAQTFGDTDALRKFGEAKNEQYRKLARGAK